MSGCSLSSDEALYKALQKIATVVKSLENIQVEAIMVKRLVDLAIIEISKENPTEVELIKRMKKQFPDTIIVVDGDQDREVIAKAFSYGAKDVFRKPYDRALLVERVKVLQSLWYEGEDYNLKLILFERGW